MERLEDHKDYPKVDFWEEVLNRYVKAENEAGAKFLTDNSVLSVVVGKRKQVTPAVYIKLLNEYVVDVGDFARIIEREIKTKKLLEAKKAKRAALEAMFWEGYKGMVTQHGWQDVFGRCA